MRTTAGGVTSSLLAREVVVTGSSVDDCRRYSSARYSRRACVIESAASPLANGSSAETGCTAASSSSPQNPLD